MKLIQFAVACLLATSGCLSANLPEAPPTPGPVTPHEPKFSDSTGALVVRVIDEELQPIADADVSVQDLQLQSETDDSGKVGFDDLTPGTYTILAAALGYEQQARKTEVRAGEATDLQVTLRRISLATPYSETFQKKGLWKCDIQSGASRIGDVCAEIGARDMDLPLTHGWNATVVEAVTKPTQSFGAKGLLVSLYTKEGGTCFFWAPHISPFRLQFNYGETVPHPCGTRQQQPLPLIPMTLRLSFAAWPGGGQTDASISIEQPWEGYATVFYFEPPPPDFSVLPDE